MWINEIFLLEDRIYMLTLRNKFKIRGLRNIENKEVVVGNCKLNEKSGDINIR